MKDIWINTDDDIKIFIVLFLGFFSLASLVAVAVTVNHYIDVTHPQPTPIVQEKK